MVRTGAWVGETLSRKDYEDGAFPFFLNAIIKNLDVDFDSDREFRIAIMETAIDSIAKAPDISDETKELYIDTCMIHVSVMTDELLDKYVVLAESQV